MKANGETAATMCQTLGIGRTTLYRYLGYSPSWVIWLSALSSGLAAR
jgi:hypothetical protein